MAHHHHHHHHHAHVHTRGEDRRRMLVALWINVAMLVAGVVGGIAFNSLALLADAGHVLADIAAIALGLFAAWLAARPATPQRTFGFQRAEIIAALVNGLTLVAISVLIFVAAIARLSDPPEVEGAGVLLLGLVGLAGNGVAAWVLMRGDRSNVNLEGVLRHTAADALGSLGVVVAGALVIATGWDQADPIVSLLIGLLILLGSWRLVREPFDVLLEAAPAGMEVEQIGQAMCEVPGVREVHDLHVWEVTSGFPALSAHVRTEPGEDPNQVREQIEAVLADRFHLEHTTLQVVVEPLLQIEDLRTERP